MSEPVDEQVVVPIVEAEPKRRRIARGRCPKGQEEDMRDVDQWVCEYRPEIYKRMNFTDPRHPFWCNLCNTRVLAQRKHDQTILAETRDQS